MTDKPAPARAWLPETALTAPRTAGAIGGTIEDWTAYWFAAPVLSVQAQWALLPVEPERGEAWTPARPISPHLELQCRADAGDIVGRALLPLSAAKGPSQAKDGELLRSVGNNMLADLAERLERFAASLDGPAWEPGSAADALRFGLALEDDGGNAVIRLLADSTLLVALARRSAKPRREGFPLVGRADAVADVTVECGALLGRANLTYRDVHGLAVGDVLILDARHDAPADLLVDGELAARGAVHVPRKVPKTPPQSQGPSH